MKRYSISDVSPELLALAPKDGLGKIVVWRNKRYFLGPILNKSIMIERLKGDRNYDKAK